MKLPTLLFRLKKHLTNLFGLYSKLRVAEYHKHASGDFIVVINHIYSTPAKIRLRGILTQFNPTDFVLSANLLGESEALNQEISFASSFYGSSEKEKFELFIPNLNDRAKISLIVKRSGLSEEFSIHKKYGVCEAKDLISCIVYNPETDSSITSQEYVSIVIPYRNEGRRTLNLIKHLVDDSNLFIDQFILLNNQSNKEETVVISSFLQERGLENIFIDCNYKFNYSRILNEIGDSGDIGYIMFINNDVELVKDVSYADMFHLIREQSVGIVAPKLLYPDGSIQSCGISVTEVQPLYSWKHYPDDPQNPWLSQTHEVSAVTGACMVMRREVFEEVGGWDENLPVTLNDVDFCLKVRAAGYKVVVHPKVKMIHHESLTRGKHDAAENYERTQVEKKYFKKKWKKWLKKGDPFYSKKLSRKYPDFRLRKYD